ISLFCKILVKIRLWQDAENKKLLANLLKRNIEQKPKVLTIEDKLIVLGCKDLERRIVEVEMDLTLAKSQGYLKHQLPQSESYSQRKLLAIIGVYTRFGSYLKRNTLEVLGCLEVSCCFIPLLLCNWWALMGLTTLKLVVLIEEIAWIAILMRKIVR
ncbi:hypothetical protein Gotur_018794, partial [Gossypium turneri]